MRRAVAAVKKDMFESREALLELFTYHYARQILSNEEHIYLHTPGFCRIPYLQSRSTAMGDECELCDALRLVFCMLQIFVSA